MKDQINRQQEFLDHLSKASDQLARISENRALKSGDLGEQLRAKSVVLMTEAIRFYDSALCYFADDFAGIID